MPDEVTTDQMDLGPGEGEELAEAPIYDDPEKEDDAGDPTTADDLPGEATDEGAAAGERAGDDTPAKPGGTDDDADEPADKADDEEAEAPEETGDERFAFQADGEEKESLTPAEITERLTELHDGRGAIQQGKESIEIANGVIRELVENPGQALLDALTNAKHNGDTEGAREELVEIAKGILTDRVKFMNLDPEERANRIWQERLGREQSARQKAEQELQGYHSQLAEDTEYQRLMKEFAPALEEAKLQNNGTNVRRVAEKVQAGDGGLSVADAARLVKQDLTRDASENIKGMSAEELIASRPDLAELINKQNIEKVAASKSEPVTAQKPEAEMFSGDEMDVEQTTVSSDDLEAHLFERLKK